MLPPSFLSTYKKYKHDTNVVASWLVATAKERGYTAKLTPPTQASSGRPKGKARKQDKAGTQAKDLKNVLAIRDFVPLAEFIAVTPAPEAGDEAAIPSFIGGALDRAIRVRTAFSKGLALLKQNFSSHADYTHAHFVTVLEKVRDVLVASGDASAGDASDADASSGSAKKSSGPGHNLFEALRFYEPSEEFLNAPDATPAPTFEVNYTVEDNTNEEDSRNECLFAFIALLKDIFSIREEIAKLWAEYRAGSLDLAAAAVGTNMAIGLARSIEEEMEPLLKKHGGALELVRLIFEALCKAQGEDRQAKKRARDELNFDVYELGSTFLYNSIGLLEAVLKAAPYSASEMPSYNGKFGWYDCEQSEEARTNLRTRWALEKAAMLEVIPDYTLIFELKGIPVIDQFGHGLKIMFETQYIPLWLSFAAQTYLDTLHFFGRDVKATQIEFERFNRLAGEQIDVAIKAAPVSNKEVVVDLEDMRKMVTIKTRGIDIFTAARKAMSYQTGRSARPSGFYRHNPIFCGMWIHYTRAMFHQKGVTYAAKPGAVLHLVQLYKAIQQQSPSGSELEWSDLDRLLEMQGSGAFFFGSEPPTSPEAHFKNYCMSRGISPSNWIAPENRRKGKGGSVPVQQTKAGVRKLKFKAPLSLWSASRMERVKAGEPERKAWDTAFVQRLLEASGSQVEKSLPAPQLVHQAAHAIRAEVPDALFSYYVLHQTAEALFKQLEQEADEIGLPKIPADVRASVRIETADFAGLIFSTAKDHPDVLTRVQSVVEEFFEGQSEKSVVPATRMSQEMTIKSAL